MPDMNRVTLIDVAALAGVSVPTVSKVLNGRGRVAPETRARIADAAERLGFQPNALAQFFATGKSHTVAVLAQKATGTFSMPVILGISKRLARDGVAVIIYDAVEDDVSDRPENIRKLVARQIDGVIVVGDGNDRTFPSLSNALAAPVVYAFGVSDDPSDPAFVPDDVMAGRLAATHLIEKGRCKIAHVTGDSGSQAVQNRANGVQTALADAGLTLALDEPLYGAWTREFGRTSANLILQSIHDIDAVICGNDFIAMGLVEVLVSHGIRVPQDIAVVGHDAWEQYIGDDAFITSIDPQLSEVGIAAADCLIRMMNGDKQLAATGPLPCELKVGQSS
jgi:LacI family transcriptional regulator